MTTAERYEVDITIIGAGPTGLFAAYYAGFRELSIAVVDSLPEAGGQVTAMYPEKQIFDVAGFPSIKGRDLVGQLVDQADQYKPKYLLGRMARSLTEVPDGLEIGLADGSVVHTGAVLITAGMGEFTPRPLPTGNEWLGRGLVHFVKSLEVYRDQDVLVVGGGDSAFDWALNLHPIARSITLVHRRAKFRAMEGTVRAVRELGVPIITDAEVAELRADDAGVLSAAVIDQKKEGGQLELPVQAVIAALGFTADLGPIEGWELELEKRAITVDTRMRTARQRVYAAGDVATYPGKVKLIATGFGEAATAVNNIAVDLNPDAHLFPGHSSDAG
ncbi:thioredoxin reductase (NADPH) [Tamaricihabitans halophyticus]|uniref:Ferredoxin--NADP reductase n=1 Tax=Tamaricihabitans halophyticus TaxID=1262583 RepID=A0A4V2SUY0_9PSEU|nr:NAD(P)/FAD-dependent oxidoreductase [Tamaricihabitans halophyticus]TCP56286.1 thioredoxin reductase (NADPH) [Tamaricihabitans halophyticus]